MKIWSWVIRDVTIGTPHMRGQCCTVVLHGEIGTCGLNVIKMQGKREGVIKQPRGLDSQRIGALDWSNQSRTTLKLLTLLLSPDSRVITA